MGELGELAANRALAGFLLILGSEVRYRQFVRLGGLIS
jgi:hypothetical protein